MVKKTGKKENKTKKKEVTTKKKENNTKKTQEPKALGKKIIPIIFIVIIVCIIGVILITMDQESISAKAQLIFDSGTVEVKHGEGTWISAEDGMELYDSDSIRTGENSSASIILFKTSIVRLDSNTELTLKEIMQQEETSIIIEQDAGRTWNTVQKMSGIDNYEVQTPTTVASVRGTSFDVYILANGNIIVTVGNGTVNVTNYENGEIVSSIEVPQNLHVSINPDNLSEVPELKPAELDDWILENLEKDDEFRGNIKAELYSRIEPFIPELKETYGVTDEELEVLIDSYLSGDFEIPSDAPDWAKKLFEFS